MSGSRVDVLAIGAHPDDVELGAGGTLALATDRGLRVVMVDLTMGEASSRRRPDARAAEGRPAAEILGISERRSLGLPDGHLGTDPRHRDAVTELLRALAPDVVVAPAEADRHPDHAAAGRLVREAVFLAGVAGLGEGPPTRPRRVFHYMIHDPFEPSFVVDVTSVWDRKMEAIRAHASQFAPEGAPTEIGSGRFLDVVEARATAFGAMVGVRCGEPFLVRGPLHADGLPIPPPDEAGGYRVYR